MLARTRMTPNDTDPSAEPSAKRRVVGDGDDGVADPLVDLEVARPPASRRLGELLVLEEVDFILLHYEWSGMNEHSPIAAVYDLRRDARGGFSGRGQLSTRLTAPRDLDVALTPRATKAFLRKLARVPLRNGPYEPLVEHTDDFPHIEFLLHVPSVGGACWPGGACTVQVCTTSQGEFHAPWAVSVGGRIYQSSGDDIGRAVRGLDRPLQRRELNRMIKQYDDGARTEP